MSKIRIAVLVLVCSMFGTIGGAVGGYYAAVTTPVAASVAVLDVEALARGIDSKAPDYLAKMKEVSAAAKEMTAKLTASGLVVLDRAQVIGAPDEAIIRVTPNQ